MDYSDEVDNFDRQFCLEPSQLQCSRGRHCYHTTLGPGHPSDVVASSPEAGIVA